MLRRFKKSCIGFESHETREKSPCDLFDKQCKNNVALQYFIRRVGDTPLIFLLVFFPYSFPVKPFARIWILQIYLGVDPAWKGANIFLLEK